MQVDVSTSRRAPDAAHADALRRLHSWAPSTINQSRIVRRAGRSDRVSKCVHGSWTSKERVHTLGPSSLLGVGDEECRISTLAELLACHRKNFRSLVVTPASLSSVVRTVKMLDHLSPIAPVSDEFAAKSRRVREIAVKNFSAFSMSPADINWACARSASCNRPCSETLVKAYLLAWGST